MSFYDELFINTILLLFPICIYLLYVAFSNNTSKQKDMLIFDFINLTSVYLLIRYKIYFSDLVFLLLINVPLIISYIKNRSVASLIISLIIIIYYVTCYNFYWLMVVIEYIIYFMLYYFVYRYKKNIDNFLYIFIFIKGLVLSIEIFYVLPTSLDISTNIIRIFLTLLIFYIITFLVILLLKKGEEILSLNKVLKELEHEKALRSSLFKITHEIKNPLAVCKGYLDMIDYKNLNNAIKYNDIIKNEIDRTLNLMDDFLDYTKVKVNLDIMDLTMLLEDTITTIRPLLKDKKILLEEKISKEEVDIEGDYNRLKQVFINIIKNSIEAIDHKNGLIVISMKETNDKVKVMINDNGCGMDKETLSKINETFFTTKVKGTGLGVTLSKEIIERHNGILKYDTKENEGTKVTIILKKLKSE